MKALRCFLIAVTFGGFADAGEITLYNDQPFVRFVRIKHRREKLVVTWLFPGQRVTVFIDETRRGRPILTVDYINPYYGSGREPKTTVKSYLLPKKAEPRYLNTSWFPRGA
ncbi:hypothetical protein [Luteolibacter marinus]|uniref:hypothetical protein n=1 Tax=Luteolibacter marinus TaxID=2776705 RepID=UPI0018677C87|nr:hypothetical protein [Luteolibacter marinus]